ncbi:MAG TPA: PAS domain-containing protein, partial [Roseivirga sp.]
MIYGLIIACIFTLCFAFLFWRERNLRIHTSQDLDISLKRKKALRQSLELLMDHSSDFYFRFDRDAFVNYSSSNVERLLGFAKEEGPVHISRIITDNPINHTIYDHIEALFNLEIEEIKPYFLEIKDNFGNRRMLEIYESPHLNNEGEVDYINAIARDLTTVYKAELELKESER